MIELVVSFITTESISFTEIFWTFDNDTRDLYNAYNGVIINNASYSSPGITGYGSSPELDLSNSNFTFELWI